jgi:hypothetical protein
MAFGHAQVRQRSAVQGGCCGVTGQPALYPGRNAQTSPSAPGRSPNVSASQGLPGPELSTRRQTPGCDRAPTAAEARRTPALTPRLTLKKCHEFETDHGDNAVRQLRKPRSRKINMSSGLRPYTPPRAYIQYL